MFNLGTYSKTLTAVIVGIIGWATQVVNSAPKGITSAEWVALATVWAVALGVYGVSNAPSSTAGGTTPPTPGSVILGLGNALGSGTGLTWSASTASTPTVTFQGAPTQISEATPGVPADATTSTDVADVLDERGNPKAAQ